ncbi:MAG: hypothetical protein OET90_00895 [Desulfuromonadales bacterium]|nr:hypothetical protein [Desulfuromonadales bacterium]
MLPVSHLSQSGLKDKLLYPTLLCLFGLLLGLQDILHGFWRFDDGGHLLWALQHGLFDYFLDPEVTRKVTMGQLTPWNTFFYDLNITLFGFAPRPMYLHLHLASGVVGALFYLLLRQQRCSAGLALLASAAFLCSAAWQSISHTVMAAHYVYGLLFAQLALLSGVKALRCEADASLRAGVWAVAASVCYASALACKEFYVPLPLVLAGLAVVAAQDDKSGGKSLLLRKLWPFALLWGAVLLGYVAWRHEVVSGMLGSYHASGPLGGVDALGLAGTVKVMLSMLLALPAGGVGWLEAVYGLLFALVALLLLKMGWRDRFAAALILGASLSVVLLLSFLGAAQLQLITPPPRYAVMLVWTLLLVAALAFRERDESLSGKKATMLLLTLLLATNAVYALKHVQPTFPESESYYRFAIGATDTPGTLLLPQMSTAIYKDQLWVFRQVYERLGKELPQRNWSVSAAQPLCLAAETGHPYWFWSPAQRKLVVCE